MKRISYENLLNFHELVLRKAGLNKESVEAVTIGLCETSLRGVDSHGIRLLPHYVRSAILGRKNPNPSFRFSQKYPAIGILDADNAFGHTAGMKAIDYCIKMADEFGTGTVAVTNSSHPGAMASMALKAARMGYIAFAFTHADSLLLSYNGKRPYFGTNPICMAVPRIEQEPYCLDMATTMISWNKLLNFRANNLPLSNNLAADSEGIMTTDPEHAVSLYPIGSYKGYGLASMVEILCGVFTGMAFGRGISSMYKASMDKPRKLGQFYIVLRTDGCLDQEVFAERMQRLSDEIRQEPAQLGQKVMLPNDPEIAVMKERMKNGIPLDESTYLALKMLSGEFDVSLQLID